VHALDRGLHFMDDSAPMTFAAAAFPLAVETPSPGTVLLAVAAVTLYIASRAAADALAGGDPAKAGLRAVGHCLPIAVVALLCLRPSLARPGIDTAAVGRPQMALGLLFANGVACVTLLLGIVTYLAPLTAPPATRRVWPFVLPVAMLSLVAGFNGALNWMHAGMLLVLGAAVLNLWLGAGGDVPMANPAEGEYHPDPGGSSGNVTRAARPHPERPWSRSLQFALAVALSIVGGWAMTRGASQLEQSSRVMTGVVLAGTVMAPLLALPVLGTCSRLAERGQSGSAVSTLVAIVLINLCAILPVVIILHHVIAGFSRAPESADLSATYSAMEVLFPSQAPAVTYPLISWRVDTVVLAVAGLAMIPWAVGRWTISRAESVALIFAYAVYLALVAILSRRWN
jgi:Ca2+/Na+ antiporter